MDKLSTRKALVQSRLDMPDRLAKADLLQQVLRIWLVDSPHEVIGAYWPIKGEFDPLPALYRWQEDASLAWILEQKDLQYSSKKASFFDKDRADFTPETGVEIERHVPEEKECVEVEVIPELVKEEEFLTVHKDHLPNLLGKTIKWKAPAYRGNSPYGGVAKIVEIKDDRRPVISTNFEGDNLDFCFIDDGFLAYSDSDRLVTYVLNEKQW